MKKKVIKNKDKKKVIKNKDSTPKQLPTILGTARAYEFIRTNPVTEDFINHVCDKLIEYACSKDALFIGCFIRDMRIPRQTFYNWIERWPQLTAAVEEAKAYIAYGRIQGAATRHFDKNVILHSQYRFGKEWVKDDAYQAELKKASDDKAAGVINVYTAKPEEVIDRDRYKPYGPEKEKNSE